MQLNVPTQVTLERVGTQLILTVGGNSVYAYSDSIVDQTLLDYNYRLGTRGMAGGGIFDPLSGTITDASLVIYETDSNTQGHHSY
eukprot:TRINITY_DN9461_c0_g1_i1.p1 TRINITY_DN9461_c0_g1~~TRINITY_DN9461_c0_g1_i1.p1  ORF type:complete len:85 (-),score=5.33 TRINITY_DN9461_c0_g1_i1:156-410(-)